MNIEPIDIGGIPVTLIRDGYRGHTNASGVVLCYHGLGSSTQDWVHDLQRLAREGFTVVGVDCVGHGRRRRPDLDALLADARHKDEAFITVVRETSDEIPVLVDGLARHDLLTDAGLGLFGVSMGGFIAYAAVAKEPRLVAVVSLLGSPNWWMLPSPESPHRRIEDFDRVKLLSMTAGRDRNVPRVYATVFHERLEERFADHEERFLYTHYPRSGHRMEAEDWDHAIGESCRWFHSHL